MKWGDYKQMISAVLLLLVILVLSIYAYLNAILYDPIGDSILIIVCAIMLLARILYGHEIKINRVEAFFVCVYIFLAFFSATIPFSKYVSLQWFDSSSFRLLVFLIVSSMYNQFTPVEYRWLRYLLVIFYLFILSYIMLDISDHAEKKWLAFITPFSTVLEHKRAWFGWNSKYIASWLVLLCWGAVSVIWSDSIKHRIVTCLVFLITFIVVFQLPSEGAQVALCFGFLVFLIQIIFPHKWYYRFCGVILLSIYVVPLMFALHCSKIDVLEKNLANIESARGLDAIVSVRSVIYGSAAKIILARPILGYGIGSPASIPLEKKVEPVFEDYDNKNILPGKHPHNFVLWFMIEFGIIGLLLLGSVTFYYFYSFYKKRTNRSDVEFSMPLLFSFLTICSFSYSIWQADIVIFLLLFVILLKIDWNHQENMNY